MAPDLRKTLSYVQVGNKNEPGSYGFETTLNGQYSAPNVSITAGTNTKYVRVFACWNRLQPFSDFGPGQYTGDPKVRDPSLNDGTGYPIPSVYKAELDRTIQLANQNGVGVILCSYGFPRWTNGQTRRQYQSDPVRQYQKGHLAWPDTLDAQSPWASWIRWIFGTYTFNGQRPYVGTLEFINEPNFECWPQDYASCNTTTMFQTAKIVSDASPQKLALMGPSTADVNGDDRSSSYESFTQSVAALLRDINFSDPLFIWSHHNYADVTNGNIVKSSRVFQILNEQSWRGARVQSGPAIWLTEGGVKRGQLGVPESQKNSLQVTRLQQQWSALQAAPGIIGFTNWETYTSPGAGLHDTGILENYVTFGPWYPRPAYYTWASFPGRV